MLLMDFFRYFKQIAFFPSLSISLFSLVVAFFRLLIDDRESGASPSHKLLMASLPLSLSPSLHSTPTSPTN